MKALAVLLELKDCSDYWSEYTVPIGIHERIDEAIQELLTQSDIVESIAANAIINDLKELFAKPDDHIKSLLEEICSLRDQNALLKETKELLAQPEPFKPDWANYRQGVEDAKREDLREGITLRDHFAGLAMQGLLSSDINTKWDEDDIALISYGQADAMLERREEDS